MLFPLKNAGFQSEVLRFVKIVRFRLRLQRFFTGRHRHVGVIGRAGFYRIQQLQVYFVLMPANIIVGILLFAILLVMMMGWYLSAFESHLAMWRG